MSCIFLCSSFHLFICIQTVPFTNILHSYFADQLTYISPFTKPSSICKCDKALEPLSTCPISFNYFYPLQLFLPFYMYPNLPIHKYPLFISAEQATNISPFTVPSSICKCDKPLVPLSTCLAYFPPLYCSFRSEGAPVHVCSCDFMSFVCLFVQLRL